MGTIEIVASMLTFAALVLSWFVLPAEAHSALRVAPDAMTSAA